MIRNKLFNFLAAGWICSILAACATAKLNLDQATEGQWEARALIREAKTGKSYVVKLDIAALKDKALRVDATAALGYPVASLLWADRAIDLVLFEDKKFYSGPVTPNLMDNVIKVPLDLEVWQDIVFDRPVTHKSWSCTQDAQGFVLECIKGSGASRVSWYDRAGSKRSVKIETNASVVQVHFQSYKPKVEAREKVFALKPPKGFSRFIL